MKKIIFNQNCNYKNKYYKKGQELKKYKHEDLTEIWKLNEKGYIEPLTVNEFREIVKLNKESEE